MKVTKEGIAKHISDALQDHEPPMTIQQLATKTGLTPSKLKRIVSGTVDENGNKRLPTSDDLLEIAKALDVSPYKILTGNDDENHVVCESLGLSNHTINVLKRQYQYYPQNEIVMLFDLLAVHTDLVSYLYQYLTTDYQKPHVLLAESEYDEAISKQTAFSDLYPTPPETWDTTMLLSVVTRLKTVKDRIKGGKTDETGKR